MYGPQFFDYKFTYTQTFLWAEPFFRSQKGILGHALGGWSIAPIFTARSGAPLAVGGLSCCESFGETQNSGTLDGAVLGAPYTGGTNATLQHQHRRTARRARASTATQVNGGNSMNMFANPAATFNEFRPCILGYDTSCGSNGQIRGIVELEYGSEHRQGHEPLPGAGGGHPVLPIHQRVQSRYYARPGAEHQAIPSNWGVLGSNNPAPQPRRSV